MTQHNEVVEAIYESALEPTRWPSALSKISSNLDVVDATIVLQDTHPNLLVSSGHDAEYIEYLRDWRDLDTIRSRVSDTVPVGHIYADWQLITDTETRRDPFYQDFRRRYGVHHLVGRVDRYSPGKVLRFAVQLPAGREPPGSEFVESFGQVANHVCRAFELSSRLAPGAAYVSHFGQELSRSRYAAAILDSEGRVVFANGRFMALGSQGLDIFDGRLVCANPADQLGLDELLRAALGQAMPGRRRLALISSSEQDRSLAVRAVPLTARQQAVVETDGLKRPRALVLALAFDDEPSSDLEDLLRVLGLTGSECRIAVLVGQGLPPREIARTLQLTEGTVRTRLKGMFVKLQLSRQSEVTRLVTQLRMFDAGW